MTDAAPPALEDLRELVRDRLGAPAAPDARRYPIKSFTHKDL